MKKIVLSLTALAVALTSYAQQDVYLDIAHKLSANTFAYGQQTTNNLSDDYEFTRLEYYISEVTLTFDGGQDTTLQDYYLLVRGDQPVYEYLGSFNFTTLEGISFGLGVDQAKNHEDPSTYPSGHPLGFQSPSMHWGWAAGYRFAALEGNAGVGMSQGWQVHALGDKNYDYAAISTPGNTSGSDLVIEIDADYTGIFTDVTVNSTLNYHGEDQVAPIVLTNFRKNVFSKRANSTGIADAGNNQSFNLYPNPSSGLIWIDTQDLSETMGTITVMDITGRVITTMNVAFGTPLSIELPEQGIYLVSVQTGNEVIYTERVIIK